MCGKGVRIVMNSTKDLLHKSYNLTHFEIQLGTCIGNSLHHRPLPPSPPLPPPPPSTRPPMTQRNTNFADLVFHRVVQDKLMKPLFLKELLLQQAVVISRHGSRMLLTKDHKTFEEGMDSQLTIRGMDQMFRAGTFVQSHYQKVNFLTNVYSPPDIYVRSSDYSRTLNR